MTYVSPVLDLLDNAGLLRGQAVDSRRAFRLSAGQLSDVGAQAALITSAADVPREGELLTHSATLSLGGGAEPCSELACRSRHVDNLVAFAALYSDRVFIHNFLSNHEHVPHAGYRPTLQERRRTLLNDLQVLARVRPMIEAGLLVPVTPANDVCNQCLALRAFGTEADKRFAEERKRLAKRFFAQMSVSLETIGDEWALTYEAPEELLEHGGVTTYYRDLPAPLDQMPRILLRALEGAPVTLSRDVRRKLGAHEAAANHVFGSVTFEMAMAQVLGTAFLSDTALPLEVLGAISGDPDLAKRNSLIQKHITSLVPFVGNVPPTKIVELRRREEESFSTYRQALTKAVDDVRSRRTDLTERDARSIYSDVIAPGLSRLDGAMKSARRDLLKDLGRSMGGWVAAISFGMYTGLLPDQLALAAKALGLVKVLADGVGTAVKAASAEDTIRKDDLYFLWKVRQFSRRRG